MLVRARGLACSAGSRRQDGCVCWTGWERRWWMRSPGGPSLLGRQSWQQPTSRSTHTNYHHLARHNSREIIHLIILSSEVTGHNVSRMLTEIGVDVSSNRRMCQTSLTCTLLPTKNKSLVLCQPIVLAPVFVFILPPLQKLCFILQHFYTAQLLCYCADNTEFTGGTKNMDGNNKLVPTPKQHSELSTSSVKLSQVPSDSIQLRHQRGSKWCSL